jgi:hypothetical protein
LIDCGAIFFACGIILVGCGATFIDLYGQNRNRFQISKPFSLLRIPKNQYEPGIKENSGWGMRIMLKY